MWEKKKLTSIKGKKILSKNTKATVCPIVSTIPTRFNYFIKTNKHVLKEMSVSFLKLQSYG